MKWALRWLLCNYLVWNSVAKGHMNVPDLRANTWIFEGEDTRLRDPLDTLLDMLQGGGSVNHLVADSRLQALVVYPSKANIFLRCGVR